MSLRSPFRKGHPMAYRHRGQATFEFVLMLPIYVIWLLLMIDFGMLMYQYVSVSNSVREGARYGAVLCNGTCTVTEIQDRTLERAGGALSGVGEITVRGISRGGTAGVNERGDSVIVSATHNYTFLFIPGAMIPVYSCADMRRERSDSASNVASGLEC